jgi:hypothetical protein
MKPKYIHILSILLTVLYGLFVVFLYATEPRTIAEVSDRAGETVDSVVNKGQVITGTYEVDAAKFAEGLRAFRSDNFPLARDRFIAADPERRDPKTQFYIAYSYYRQGWGRFSNDDELFKEGLAETGRLVKLDPDFHSDDASLGMRTAAELRYEFEEGLKISATDFYPQKVFRERK